MEVRQLRSSGDRIGHVLAAGNDVAQAVAAAGAALLIQVGVPVWTQSDLQRALWPVSAVLIVNTVLVVFRQVPLTSRIGSAPAVVHAQHLASLRRAESC